MPIVLSVPKSLRSCGRVAAASALCEWSSGPVGRDLGLPDRPVTVELSPKPELTRHQVGRFVVEGWGRRFVDRFWVMIAIGRRPDGGWEAQLASIPHELAHVGQWVRLFGERTPWEVVSPDFEAGVVGLPSLAPWRRFEHEGGGGSSPESIARRLTPAFLKVHPEYIYPRCRDDCPCRGVRR